MACGSGSASTGSGAARVMDSPSLTRYLGTSTDAPSILTASERIRSLIRLRENSEKRAARNASSRIPTSLSRTVASKLSSWIGPSAMTHPQDDYEKDEPLSAEAEAVMAKVRRRAGL